MNQLFQQLNQLSKGQQTNPMISFLQKKYNECKMAVNPTAYLQNMIQSNPQMKEAMNMVQQNGGDMKQLFYKLYRFVKPLSSLGHNICET